MLIVHGCCTTWQRVGDGLVRLVRGGEAVTVFDLSVEGVTHLHR